MWTATAVGARPAGEWAGARAGDAGAVGEGEAPGAEPSADEGCDGGVAFRRMRGSSACPSACPGTADGELPGLSLSLLQ